jgi:hypothetical protein
MPTKTRTRKSAKRKVTSSKKDKLACRECGLVLTVDEMCGCADLSGVVCCGEPMKSKK